MNVSSPIVTCLSCIASRRALCTLAGARLISSARTKLAKIGPFFTSKVSFFTLYIRVPTTSAGSKSGVNWTLLYFAETRLARVLIANVFARPGTPSRSTCPLQRRAINNESTRCFCPTILRSMPVRIMLTKLLLEAMRSLSSRMFTVSSIIWLKFIMSICCNQQHFINQQLKVSVFHAVSQSKCKNSIY